MVLPSGARHEPLVRCCPGRTSAAYYPLGALAGDDDHNARLRGTLGAFLQENGSYSAGQPVAGPRSPQAGRACAAMTAG